VAHHFTNDISDFHFYHIKLTYGIHTHLLRNTSPCSCLSSFLQLSSSLRTSQKLLRTGKETAVAGEDRRLITGGSDASPERFPFYVQGQGCGGTLIHDDIVLTAAHCKDHPDLVVSAFNDYVYVGNVIGNSTEQGAERIPTVRDKQVQHHDYGHPSQFYNDIMVVKLQRPANTTLHPPARLNRDSLYPPLFTQLLLPGFGLTGALCTGTPSTHLKYIDIYPELCLLLDNWEILCTSDALLQHKVGCKGDSGGPVVDSTGLLVGVYNGGLQDFLDAPEYSARVSSFASWIDEQVCQLSASPPRNCAPRRMLRSG
jgi:secreted trypsin-like serine protease